MTKALSYLGGITGMLMVLFAVLLSGTRTELFAIGLGIAALSMLLFIMVRER